MAIPVPQDHILLKDALEIMRKRDENGFPKPFTIHYTQLDRKRGTGGKLVKAKATMPSGRINRKMYKNALRNIKIVGKQHLVSVHIYLISKINGKWVI